MSIHKDENTVTVKIALHDSKRTKIVKIDPVARLQLMKAKQELNEEADDELANEMKNKLMDNYKKIAARIDILVKSHKSSALAKNKVAKPPRKTSKSIRLNRADLLYDIEGVSNEDDKDKRGTKNNVIMKENNIIIDNINDENLRINISNIINREIEKSTQQSSLNAVLETAAQPGTIGAKASFTTPASKVTSFSVCTSEKDVNDLEEEEGPRKRKKRTATTDAADKKVDFLVPQIKQNKSAAAEKNLSSKKPLFNLGGMRANNEITKLPSLGLGASQAPEDNRKDASTISFKNKVSAGEDKPATSFNFAKKNDNTSAMPAFNLGGTKSVGADDSKGTFPFTQGDNNPAKDSKPPSSFNSADIKKVANDSAKLALGLQNTSDQEIKPKFSFGTHANSKPTLPADVTKSSASTALLPEPPNNAPESQPLFDLSDKSGKQQFSFSSGKQSITSKEQPSTAFTSLDKPVSRFNPASTGTAASNKPGSRFEAPSLAEKPNSRFDPTPVGDRPLSSFVPQNNKPVFGFASGAKDENQKPAFDVKASIATAENGTIKQPASSAFKFSGSGITMPNVAQSESKSGFSLGQPPGSISSSNSAKPEFNFSGSSASAENNNSNATPGKLFNSNNNPTNGESKFSFGQPSASKPPVTSNLQSTFNFGQNNNNSSHFGDNSNKFITNTPPNPLLQKPVTGFNFESNNNSAAGQLNFNLSNKFKSPTPPVPQMNVNLPQQGSFNPSSTLNFSFSSNNANSNGTPFGKSLSPPMNSNQNPPNMMFGGFNQQSQQASPNIGGSAPVGRRIAKLRRR